MWKAGQTQNYNFFWYIIFQFETVAADCILCLVGDDQSTDTSPDLENTDFDDPESMDSTDDPGTEVANIKRMCINNMRNNKFQSEQFQNPVEKSQIEAKSTPPNSHIHLYGIN